MQDLFLPFRKCLAVTADAVFETLPTCCLIRRSLGILRFLTSALPSQANDRNDDGDGRDHGKSPLDDED